MPKVKTPPPLDLNIDLGNWLSSAKIYFPIIEILKIPSQRDIFMKTLEEPKENMFEKYEEMSTEKPKTITKKPKEKLVSSKEKVMDKPIENLSKKQSNFNEDIPIILHSRYPNK